MKSKVESMYGDSIKEHLKEMCKYFSISHAEILLEDAGALPFTLAARFELAVKKIFPESTKEFLLPMNEKNFQCTKKNN